MATGTEPSSIHMKETAAGDRHAGRMRPDAMTSVGLPVVHVYTMGDSTAARSLPGRRHTDAAARWDAGPSARRSIRRRGAVRSPAYRWEKTRIG